MKQTDELEKVFMEKFNVIENLIESTKNTISQIQLMQCEVASSASKDINDISFSCRNMSTVDRPSFVNQHMPLSHDTNFSCRRLSTARNMNLSLPHKD